MKKDTLESRYIQILESSNTNNLFAAALSNPKNYYLHLYSEEIVDPEMGNDNRHTKGSISTVNERGKYDNFTSEIWGDELDDLIDAFEKHAPDNIVDQRD